MSNQTNKQQLQQEGPPVMEAAVKNHPINQPNEKRPESVPVRVLWVQQGRGIDIPGRSGETSATMDPEAVGTTRQHWVIEFIPRMQMFRVEHHPAGGDKSQVQTRMFAASICAWEPA